jgi:large subunit ribosomal protein L23
MTSIIRRALTTLSIAGPSTPPSIASTAPLAVRKRKDQAVLNANPTGGPIATKAPRALPPRLEAEFQALRLAGQYKGDEASGRKAFWSKQVLWRSRVRGVKASKTDFIAGPEVHEEVEADVADVNAPDGTNAEPSTSGIIAQRIYLPNIQIRLMRNNTPPGTAYDPHTATFRIPHSMTKTDLRSYLSTLYSLNPTFIRTDNYFAALKRRRDGSVAPEVGSTKSYKRAVVGLAEPFHYPDDVEELYAQGRASGAGEAAGDERKAWIEDNFRVEAMAHQKKKALMKMFKGTRWRSQSHDNGVSLCAAVHIGS